MKKLDFQKKTNYSWAWENYSTLTEFAVIGETERTEEKEQEALAVLLQLHSELRQRAGSLKDDGSDFSRLPIVQFVRLFFLLESKQYCALCGAIQDVFHQPRRRVAQKYVIPLILLLSCLSKSGSTRGDVVVLMDAGAVQGYRGTECLAVYRCIVENRYFREKLSTEQKIKFLEYASDCVKVQICGASHAGIFLEEEKNIGDIVSPYPFVELQMGRPIREEVSLDDKTIVSVPYSFDKLLLAFCDVSADGFRQEDRVPTFFREIGLILFDDDGRHHSAIASMRYKPNSLLVDAYSFEPHFGKLKTDGKEWYYNGDSVSVTDGRFVTLYILAHAIRNLKKGEGLPTY